MNLLRGIWRLFAGPPYQNPTKGLPCLRCRRPIGDHGIAFCERCLP